MIFERNIQKLTKGNSRYIEEIFVDCSQKGYLIALKVIC